MSERHFYPHKRSDTDIFMGIKVARHGRSTRGRIDTTPTSYSRVWAVLPHDHITGRAVVLYWSYDSATPAVIPEPGIGPALRRIASMAMHFFTRRRWDSPSADVAARDRRPCSRHRCRIRSQPRRMPAMGLASAPAASASTRTLHSLLCRYVCRARGGQECLWFIRSCDASGCVCHIYCYEVIVA